MTKNGKTAITVRRFFPVVKNLHICIMGGYIGSSSTSASISPVDYQSNDTNWNNDYTIQLISPAFIPKRPLKFTNEGTSDTLNRLSSTSAKLEVLSLFFSK